MLSYHWKKKQTNKQKQRERKSGVGAYDLEKLKPKTCPRIQVVKNAKCDIIHSFCFELFFFYQSWVQHI